jgi:hypothetical protein
MLPAMSISLDDDTNSSNALDSEYDSVYDSDDHMGMEDYVDALDGIDLDGDVDLKSDTDNENEENQEEEAEEEEEENGNADENENDGKERRMIGQGEMVNISAYDVDTMVDDQPIVLPEQHQQNVFQSLQASRSI